MHEAAHRLLFKHRGANDWVGNWLLGFPVITSTPAYRRVHMAHHREEFGPDEPDIPLYANYPITAESFRRKLVRDATGQTGIKLFRNQLRGFRSPDVRVRRTLLKMTLVQVIVIAAFFAAGHPWLYLTMFVLPYFTLWRVINRLRSIAEHGGLRADDDRRIATHSVVQHPIARFYLVPYNIGFHLAHHVDAGVPFRHLPKYHALLRDTRYVDDSSAYEAAHMSALAMVAIAATSPANAETVDRKGGRAALQRAAMANSSLARALGMEYPNMAGWLGGRATARCGCMMRVACRRAMF
jgi:fatty acid desaturase